MAPSTPARFEFRIRSDAKQRIEHAAGLLGESASDFARRAAEQRADEVLLEHDAVTLVPASFFDELLDALDADPQPNATLARAAARARHTANLAGGSSAVR